MLLFNIVKKTGYEIMLVVCSALISTFYLTLISRKFHCIKYSPIFPVY